MALATGTRIGVYEIVTTIGSGGMGEVYSARDTRLNRTVALKVLPPLVADDPERLARFRREAQVLASLNHPNIATVHGFEEVPGSGQGGVRALVMELVDGPTLAEMLTGRALPIAEALPIARQIAEALEFAHEQGIVHRDLKPANVKVRTDGTVKVLDFGLAKALSSDALSPASGVADSPTLTARSTQLGVILGTAAYMAPEQAKGKPVDRRADIWAFGVVLFEMLSGRRGYEADDIADTLAAVLTRDVDWTALPPDTPPRLAQLLRDCLVRDPKQRLRDIGEARRVIEKTISGSPDSTVIGLPAPASGITALPSTVVSPSPAWRRALPWAIAALAVVAAGAIGLQTLRAPSAPAGVVTRSRATLTDVSGFVALSRDGSRLVYSSAGGTMGFQLSLRQMDQFEGKPIAGTDGAYFPVFSPDGQWIAYGSSGGGGGKIKKVLVTGGTSMVLADGYFGAGADWGDDDTIVFPGQKGLMRVPATGGTPTTLTTVDATKNEAAHVRPQFLPGGRQLLFTVLGPEPGPQFAVLDLASGAYRTVAPGGDNGRYVPTGHLTYVRGGTLFAVPFDLTTLTTIGTAAPVVANVSSQGPTGTGDYTFSRNGLLVYSEAVQADGTTLAWADRRGVVQPIPGQEPRKWGTGRLSPDGSRVANGVHGEKGTDIWIMGLDRGTATRVTFGGENDRPIWTRDGRTVIYSAEADGKFGLYAVPADGSAAPFVVLATEKRLAVPMSISPDGKTLLYRHFDQAGRTKIFVLPLSGLLASGEPRPLREGNAIDTDAEFSPDGKWVAFASGESGRSEIYLIPFPGPGGRIPVSREGGRDPRWSRDGRELFFWPGSPANIGMYGVSVKTTPAAEVGIPAVLFKAAFGTTWGPAPDGKFLVEGIGTAGGVAGSQFAIVTNWFDELKQRAPSKAR